MNRRVLKLSKSNMNDRHYKIKKKKANSKILKMEKIKIESTSHHVLKYKNYWNRTIDIVKLKKKKFEFRDSEKNQNRK